MLLLSRLRVVEKLMMMIVTFTVVASSPTSSSSRDGGEGGGREMGANRSTKTTFASTQTCARTTKTGCAPHRVSFFCGFLPVAWKDLSDSSKVSPKK